MCIVTPTSAVDVSVALLMMRTVQCQFAVRAGGHTPFKGANNIENGITIDLRSLNTIKVSSDKKSVTLGPGNKWGEVFKVTDAAGIRVVGGRDWDVGVGGLLVGGGMSYFSGKYGFACDNVISYQVVFADGTIRDVNQKSYPDVFRALRGGGNNFGIITSFKLNAYPGGNLWGGNRRYVTAYGQLPQLIDATANYNLQHHTDPDAAIILSYIWTSGLFLAQTNLIHGKTTPNPPIFKNFTDVTTGIIQDSYREDTLLNFALELGATTASGHRQTMWTFTFKNDAAYMKDIATLFEQEIESIKAIPGVVLTLNYQVISTAISSNFAKNGGNPLGISEKDGPLILMNWSFQWDNASDDAAVMGVARSYYDKATALAKTQGLYHPYVYLNYADISLDVFSSYGAANKAELIATHQKWDKNGVFTKLMPGGFKIEK